MGIRPNLYRDLVFNGDWHTRLVTDLQMAKEGTRSLEILAAIDVLERQLAKTDECVHTATAYLIPDSINEIFLISHIKKYVDIQPSTLALASNGNIELTLTARGDYEYVHGMAQSILNRGLSSARGKIRADTVASWIPTSMD